MIEKIKKLKKEKNAVILAHNYQKKEIYQIADYVGDSLELAKIAKKVTSDIIVFCGVRFMAETAKILNPSKTVLLPEQEAGCPMANMVNEKSVASLKKQYPKAKVACYINTTAATKTLCDVCVTSANALKVIRKIGSEQIIFVPDKNLASYVAQNTTKEVIPYKGFCYVHDKFSVSDVRSIKIKYPKAKILIHPESPKEVIELADFVCSTSQMIGVSREIEETDIIVGTEVGMIEKLKQECPSKNFIPLRDDAICKTMKLTSLESVLNCLKDNKYEVQLSTETIDLANKSINRMLELS